MSARIAGELESWPSKDEMARILTAAGLGVTVGRYSIRVVECSQFVFQEYGCETGDPMVDADADSVEEMLREGGLVSEALAKAGVRHRFEIYDEQDVLAGCLQHDWPPPEPETDETEPKANEPEPEANEPVPESNVPVPESNEPAG